METSTLQCSELAARARPWFFEPEAILLALLVLGVYFTRLTTVSIRGEEPRWATVARGDGALGRLGRSPAARAGLRGSPPAE